MRVKRESKRQKSVVEVVAIVVPQLEGPHFTTPDAPVIDILDSFSSLKFIFLQFRPWITSYYKCLHIIFHLCLLPLQEKVSHTEDWFFLGNKLLEGRICDDIRLSLCVHQTVMWPIRIRPGKIFPHNPKFAILNHWVGILQMEWAPCNHGLMC